MSSHLVPTHRAEFETWLEELILTEQGHVDRMLADPDTFVISGLRKVHTTDCAVNGLEPDRRYVYHRIGDLDEIRKDIVHGGGPRFPSTATRGELAQQTAKYDRCQVCAPDVPAYTKPVGIRTHDELSSYVEKTAATGAKPARALAGVLRLHTRAGDICVEDQQAWPCGTVHAVQTVWDVHE